MTEVDTPPILATDPANLPPGSAAAVVHDDWRAILLLLVVLLLTAGNLMVGQWERLSVARDRNLAQDLSMQQCSTLFAQRQQIARLSSDLADRIVEVSVLKAQNRTTNKKLDQAERTIVSEREDFANQQAELERESDQFHKSSISYQRKMGDAHQETFEKLVAEHGERINLEVEHERLTAKYNRLLDAHSTLWANYNALESQYNSAVDQIQKFRVAYNQLEYSYTNLSAHDANLASQLTYANNQYNRLSSDYENLRYQYNRLYNAYISIGGR